MTNQIEKSCKNCNWSHSRVLCPIKDCENYSYWKPDYNTLEAKVKKMVEHITYLEDVQQLSNERKAMLDAKDFTIGVLSNQLKNYEARMETMTKFKCPHALGCIRRYDGETNVRK